MTDGELRTQLRKSPEKGARALYDTYFNYVYTIVFCILRDCAGREDMEECVMDVFMEVLRHYDTTHEGSIKAYIGTVAKRRAIDVRRVMFSRSRHTVPLESEQLAVMPSDMRVEETAEQAERSRILLDCILALGEPDAAILLQRYFYDRKTKEIAQVLGISPAGVRMRCTRAMKRLKQKLSEKGITL